MSYANHGDHSNNRSHSYDDLSINVNQGHFSYSADVDTHNRCCSGRFWCIQDICGIICALLTWFLILYAKFVVYFVILLPAIGLHTMYSVFNIVVFLALSSLALMSHVRTMLTDPVIICLVLTNSGVERLSIFISVWHAGCCTQGECHQRDDTADGARAGTGDFQVPEVLFYQA